MLPPTALGPSLSVETQWGGISAAPLTVSSVIPVAHFSSVEPDCLYFMLSMYLVVVKPMQSSYEVFVEVQQILLNLIDEIPYPVSDSVRRRLLID